MAEASGSPVHEAVITVADEGRGIPIALQPSVFVRLRKATRLGLAAHAHGGVVTLHSTLGDPWLHQ